jgi:hypothetical protein
VWVVFLLFALSVAPALAANACGRYDVRGPYGSLLSGVTTISGEPKPAVILARLVFDDDGKINGYSSVSFDGLLLGNPVTGTYEAGLDCQLSFSLQDDSGAFQHFSGVITPGGSKVDIRQTDPDVEVRGTMKRTLDSCELATFKGRYNFSLSGTTSDKGAIDADGAGHFKIIRGSEVTGDGAFEVDADCIVRIEPGTEDPVHLRGILVDGGKEILAIQTDLGNTVSARFTAR